MLDGTYCGTLYEELKNGAPLPKGHGRLIDADELFEMTNNYKAELGRLVADPFVKGGIETVEGFVTDILPTIIEADKKSEEILEYADQDTMMPAT